jgi:predicted transcriptional regulator
MTTKELVLRTLDDLPEDASIDDVIERLYLLRKIEIGLRQAESGELIEHEVVKSRFRDAVEIGYRR